LCLKAIPPSQLILQVQNALESFAHAHTPSHREARARAGVPKRWTKPHTGELKCNWDAALNIMQKKIRVGVVVRDDEGGVVSCGCLGKSLSWY